MPAKQLAQMKSAIVDINDRLDIGNIRIDVDLPVALRAEQYLSQIKNPYAFRVGDIFVNIRFKYEDRTLRDAITAYLRALK